MGRRTGHPITEGIDEQVVVPEAEMYGERFDVPAPDELVFVSWFEGGEVFRSGCCYRRGSGRIFYFRPGHETYPIYRQPEIRRILGNAVEWASSGNESRPDLRKRSGIARGSSSTANKANNNDKSTD